ncbi:MAG: hypothetical protein ACR2HK_13770, partial [Gemmatimonadales bacterium]
TLTVAAPDVLRLKIYLQLDDVASWEDFLRTRIVLEGPETVDEETRARLAALPSVLRIRGDAAPIDYEVEDGEGVARVRLREGQAKRLRSDEILLFDRPLRFALQRGRHPPILAGSIPELHAILRRGAEQEGADEEGQPSRRPRKPRKHHRTGRRR